jgi:hypothetical protein
MNKPRGYFLASAAAISLALSGQVAPAGTGYFYGNTDDWSLDEHWSDYAASPLCEFDGGKFGTWMAAFDGGGCTKIVSVDGVNHLQLSPEAIGNRVGTRSALVVSTLSQGDPNLGSDLYLNEKFKTTAQLRTSTPPNPWEVGWVIWNAGIDSECNCWTFNTFIPKPNGWQLSKVVNNGGVQDEVFLATGNTPTYPINNYYNVEIYHSNTRHNNPGDVVDVFVNGTQVVHYTGGNGVPFRSGSAAGLYTEDATVIFRRVEATRL